MPSDLTVPEMSALLAEKLMGWKRVDGPMLSRGEFCVDKDGVTVHRLQSIAEGWWCDGREEMHDILEALQRNHFVIQLNWMMDHATNAMIWRCELWASNPMWLDECRGFDANITMAVARAACAAVGGME